MKKTAILITLVSFSLCALAAPARVEAGASPDKAKTLKDLRSKKVLINAERAGSKVTLRAKADSKSKAVLAVPKFTPVEITALEGTWAKIKTENGTVGYVPKKSLTDSAFVSVTNGKANVRKGSGYEDTVVFTVNDHYPLRVTDRKDKRVKIVDYEGDAGWVHENYISTENFVIATQPTINVREGPSVDTKRRFTAQKGCIFKVVKEEKGWLRVKYLEDKSGDEGWCSAKIVWGYFDPS